tara:strand:+ start:84 stop:329 length:246 start_codon:yes stop_codon:yes gene_type:complete
MSFKMKGFSGFKSPLKQDDKNKCYINDDGEKVCSSDVAEGKDGKKVDITKQKEKKWGTTTQEELSKIGESKDESEDESEDE